MEGKPDCIPVFPFMRWASVQQKDRFGNIVPGWNNTFTPLCNILRCGLSWMQRNKEFINFDKIIPAYCETVFQIFCPITILAKELVSDKRITEKDFNCEILFSWALEIGELISRPTEFSVSEFPTPRFFPIIARYWRDFDVNKLEKLSMSLESRIKEIVDTKSIGVFGILKLDQLVYSKGPVTHNYLWSQSYGDPLFEALHLQLPMIIFNPEAIIRYIPHFQFSAYFAHPLAPLNVPNQIHSHLRLRNEFPNEKLSGSQALSFSPISPLKLLHYISSENLSRILRMTFY